MTSHSYLTKESYNLVGGVPFLKLPHCQVWWPEFLWKLRYSFFNLSRDLMLVTRPLDGHLIKGYVTLWVGAPYDMSPSCLVCFPQVI